jgi:hypothetical protein
MPLVLQLEVAAPLQLIPAFFLGECQSIFLESLDATLRPLSVQGQFRQTQAAQAFLRVALLPKELRDRLRRFNQDFHVGAACDCSL